MKMKKKKLLENFQVSGMTQAAFAVENGNGASVTDIVINFLELSILLKKNFSEETIQRKEINVW